MALQSFSTAARLYRRFITGFLPCLLWLAVAPYALAQPTLRVGTNTRLVGSGDLQLVYGGGNITNNGSLSMTTATGVLTLNGPVTYGGSGTATVGNVNFYHTTGSSTLNSLLSVTTLAVVNRTATALNANGLLYLRTDQFPGAALMNNGLLTGTVQGLATNATVQTGATAYSSQLSVNVSGNVMQYQWQSSPDNSTWTDVAGATAATYTASVSAPVYYRNRLKTTNTAYDQTTSAVLLNYTGSSSAPVIRYVKPTATGTGDGTTWANASGDLQAMIDFTGVQQVWVAAGVYKPTTDGDPSYNFSMKDGVAIYGGFGGTETSLSSRTLTYPSSTTLSGDVNNDGLLTGNSYNVIVNYSLTNSAVLDGFVITGGKGGGSDSQESRGGGVYNYGNAGFCSPTFRNCLFVANAGTEGGAMFNDGREGGISSPVLTNCAFLSNTATDGGGAIYNGGEGGTSSPVLTNCAFQGNIAPDGKAMYNSGRSFGGGTVGNSSPVLTNCVLFRNGVDKTLSNNYGATTTATYSLFETGTTGYNTGGTGNLTTATNPFVSASSVALRAGSEAIDAGNPNTTPATVGTTDLAGKPRFAGAGNRIDMGAIEYQVSAPTCLSVVYVTQAGAGARDGSTWANAYAGTALQTAIDAASACQAQVWVAGGVYKPTTTATRIISFAMRNGVAIYGGFSNTGNPTFAQRNLTYPSSTTLSGDIDNDGTPANNSYHVISNANGLNNSAILDGVIITGGNADGCVPPAIYGSGMYNVNCSPLIRNCVFEGNTASNGGAIYNDGSSNGISSPKLINCAFQRNTAANGGAVFNNGMSGNSSPVLVNCAFLSNSSTNQSGAIYNQGGGSGNSNPVLTNCVLFGNGGSRTFFNDAGTGTATVSATYSLFETGTTGYNTTEPTNLTTATSPFVSANPGTLAGVALNTCALAINAGNNAAYTTAGGPATDLAGNPRVFPTGGRIDMGAIEYQTTSGQIAITGLSPAVASVCEEQPLRVSATITGSTTYSLTLSLFNGATRVASQSVVNTGTVNITIPQGLSASSLTLVAVAVSSGGCSTSFVGGTVGVEFITFAAAPTLNSTAYSPGQTAIVSYAAGTCSFKNNGLFTVDLLSAADGYSTARNLPAVAATSTSLSVVIPANLTPGTYKLQVVYGDPVVSPVTVSFVVNTVTLTITASTTQICVGQPVSLTASGCGTGATYVWSTTQTGPIITYTPRSTSLVTVTCVSGPMPMRVAAPGEALPGAVEGDAATGPGDGQGSEADGDKTRAIIWRPARDPHGSRPNAARQ